MQGVFFRGEAQARARSLNVAGWIRNERDGSVRAVFEGERAQVESMVAWCGRGPTGAIVDEVETVWGTPEGLTGFRVD